MITPEKSSAMTDQELVRLAKSDPDYFGVLMRRYQDQLFRYMKRISNSRDEDLEDYLQEIFIKVYRNLNDYDESLKFSSWIYRISHNHVIDQFRKKHVKHPAISLEESELVNILRSAINIEKEVATKQCMEQVKSAIDALPDKYREVLILRFLEEKDYDEIMDILRKPKGTIATLINRGKHLLKDHLITNQFTCD